MKRKFLSVFSAVLIMVTMLVTSVPVNAWVQWTSPSEVSGSDYTDYPAFAKALDDLFAGDIDLYKDSKRTKEVSMPLGFRVSMNDPYYMYSTSRKTQTYGWTCFIYSNGAFNKLFGEYVHRGDSLKNCYIAVGKGASKMSYSLLANANIRAGAYIRTSPKSDGSYYGDDGHSMIILGYDSTHITYLEGNGDGKGLVRITKRTYAEFNSAQLSGKGRKVTHIVQPTDEWFEELYGNTPETSTYTFSYDANGGVCSEESFTAAYGSEFSLSCANVSRERHTFKGWQIKRDNDGKWLCKNGWSDTEGISDSNPKLLLDGNAALTLDDSFIIEGEGDTSYTVCAVWEEWIYETCTDITLISTNLNREFYPLGSTVSFEGSQLRFDFASGKSHTVTVNDSCSANTPQTFFLNGFNYSFYIDSEITAEGDNLCYARIDSLKSELTVLKGNKTVSATEMLSCPDSLSGSNAQIKVTYTDGTEETLTATRFSPLSCDENKVCGIMFTDGGFTVSWSFEVETDGKTVTATYPSGYKKSTVAGDINLDGNISATDLASLKLVLSQSHDGFYSLYCTSDFNGDGVIASSDLSMIKKYLTNN